MSETLTTTITGYDADKIEAMLVEHLARQIGEKTLHEAKRIAAERVKAVSEKLIDAEVKAVIENGWPEYKYGEPTGERFTVKSWIADYLKSNVNANRGYNEPARTPIDIAIKAATEAIFSREFEKEISEARAALRAQLHAIMNGKFAETLKEALGMR